MTRCGVALEKISTGVMFKVRVVAVGQQLNLVVGQVKDFIMIILLLFNTLGSTLFECGENSA